MSANTNSSETVHLRPTFVGDFFGTPNDGDFAVIWRGLPVARITKNIEVPVGGQLWRWQCTLSGRPLIGGDYGTGDSLDDCEAAFRTAWTRIRFELTEADIAKAVGP